MNRALFTVCALACLSLVHAGHSVEMVGREKPADFTYTRSVKDDKNLLHLYVAPTGTDGDFCGVSADAPCKSLAGVSQSVKDHVAKRQYVEKAPPRPYHVHVADGEYTGPDNAGVQLDNVNVTIAADNTGKVHLKGDKTARALLFNSGGWGHVEVRGIKFSDFSAEVGGAVYLNGTTGVIADCEFHNNEASFSGGAVQVRGGVHFKFGAMRWVVSGCKFVGNRAGRWGGGMFANVAWVVVKDSVWEDNHSESSGGHFASRAGNSTWYDTVMTGGSCNEYGGALYVRNSHVDMVRCKLGKNSADRGGAVSTTVGCRFATFDSELTDNSAGWRGGAAAFGEGGGALFSNTKLLNNAAGNSGGAVWTSKVSLAFPGSELRGNHIEPKREVDQTYWTEDDFGQPMKWGTDIHCQNAVMHFEDVAHVDALTSSFNPLRCDKYPSGSRCYAHGLDEAYCPKPKFTLEAVPPSTRERFQAMLPDEARMFMEDDMNFVVVVLGTCVTMSVFLFWCAFAIAPSPEEVRAATIAASRAQTKKNN